jgi:hypothetical protein
MEIPMNIKFSALTLVGGLGLLGPSLMPEVYGLPAPLAAAGQVVGTIATLIGAGCLAFELFERAWILIVSWRIERGVRADIALAAAMVEADKTARR